MGYRRVVWGTGEWHWGIEEIPSPIQFPDTKQVSTTKEFKRVVFDLETSSRGIVN